MSFLDESDFDGPRSYSNNNNNRQNNDYYDDDISNQFGNQVNLGTPSGSRARMLAQEREKQLKRRQNSAQNEGMIRSSSSPAPKNQGQFTPAIRQFSAPKNVKGIFEDDDDDNGKDENIERLTSATRGKPSSRNINNQKSGGYDDDDDDDDDDRYNQRRDKNNHSKLKVVNRSYGDNEDEDDYNANKRNNNNNGTKSDKMAAQIAAHHTRVMKFASDANEPSNSFHNNSSNSNNRSNYTSNQNYNNNPSSQSHQRQPAYNKGSYRDEDDDDDDMNGNDDFSNNNSNNNNNRQNSRYVAPPSQAPPLGKRSNNNRNNDDNDGESDGWATSKNNNHHQNNNNSTRNQNNNNHNQNNYRNNSNSNNNNSNHSNNNHQNDHVDDDDDDNDDEDDDDDDDDEDEEEESGHGSKNTLSSDTLSKSIHVVPLDLSDMREFLMSPVPRGSGIVQCYIKRNKVGVNKLFPVYSLYLKEPNRFLMASKKRPNNKTSNYLISMNEGDLSRDGNNYLGKLRSNFVGTEFQIFDNGVNPKESSDSGRGSIITSSNHHDHNSEVRKEMGAVIYAANVLGSRGPRKMQVAIPAVDENNNSSAFHQSLSLARSGSQALTANAASSFSNRPGSATPKRRSSFSRFVTGVTGGSGGDSASGGDSLSNGEDILARIKDKNFKDLGYFINKPPRWNDQVGAYVLNFNGRVTMASVKNFQLVDPDEINDVTLQFGRVGKDDFTMDLQWPMSPFQAFAITLSSFDSKIACD